MCLGVFIASDHPLSGVPWSEEQPAFHAAPLAERDEPVRRQFARAHVASLGAHTGCGCGFSPEQEWDAAARRRSVAALAAYVAEAARAGPVELFVCWRDAAEYVAAPERRLRLAPGELAERDDWTAERSLVEIQPPAS
jgi:hypothetical protein